MKFIILTVIFSFSVFTQDIDVDTQEQVFNQEKEAINENINTMIKRAKNDHDVFLEKLREKNLLKSKK